MVYTRSQNAYYYYNNEFHKTSYSAGEPTNENCRYVFKYPDENLYRMFTFSYPYQIVIWDLSLNTQGDLSGNTNGSTIKNNSNIDSFTDISYDYIYSIDGTNELYGSEYYYYLAVQNEIDN